MDLFLFWVACERVAGLLSRPCRSDRFSRSCCRIARGFFRRYVGVFFHGVPTKKRGLRRCLYQPRLASRGIARAGRGSCSETAKHKSFANVGGVFNVGVVGSREMPHRTECVPNNYQGCLAKGPTHTHTHTHTHTASWLRCTEM